jgi:hypothetical protein
MTAAPRLATFTTVGTLAYLGLAILGWGGFAALFAHRARIALAIATFVMSGVALFSGGNLSPGEREDRANRWVLMAFALIGLLSAYLPAYTDRKDAAGDEAPAPLAHGRVGGLCCRTGPGEAAICRQRPRPGDRLQLRLLLLAQHEFRLRSTHRQALERTQPRSSLASCARSTGMKWRCQRGRRVSGWPRKLVARPPATRDGPRLVPNHRHEGSDGPNRGQRKVEWLPSHLSERTFDGLDVDGRAI